MAFLQWLSLINQNNCQSCQQAFEKITPNAQTPHIGLHEKCLLVYYWCIVRAQDSIETISKVLELDPKDVSEIYEHLKDVFSLEDLIQRIESYTRQNHQFHDTPDLALHTQRVGHVAVAQEQDSAEERKQKIRRKKLSPMLPQGN